MRFIRSPISIGMVWHPLAYSYRVRSRNSQENLNMLFGRLRFALILNKDPVYRKNSTTRKPRILYSMRMFFCRLWALMWLSITLTHMSSRRVIWLKVRHFFISYYLFLDNYTTTTDKSVVCLLVKSWLNSKSRSIKCKKKNVSCDSAER